MKILRKIFNFQGAKTIGGGTIVGGLYIFGTLWYLYTEKERIIGTNIIPSEESVRQAIEIKQQYGNDYMNTQELGKANWAFQNRCYKLGEVYWWHNKK